MSASKKGKKKSLTLDKDELIVTQDNLDTLLPNEWVDSVVIDAYFKFLTKGRSDIFLVSAENDFPDFEKVKSYPYSLIPIFRRYHWTLAFVDSKLKRIKYLNSQLRPEHLKVITPFFKEALPDFEFDVIEAPQQCTRTDCGVYVCVFARDLIRGEKLDLACINVNFERKRIANEIKKEFMLPYSTDKIHTHNLRKRAGPAARAAAGKLTRKEQKLCKSSSCPRKMSTNWEPLEWSVTPPGVLAYQKAYELEEKRGNIPHLSRDQITRNWGARFGKEYKEQHNILHPPRFYHQHEIHRVGGEGDEDEDDQKTPKKERSAWRQFQMDNAGKGWSPEDFSREYKMMSSGSPRSPRPKSPQRRATSPVRKLSFKSPRASSKGRKSTPFARKKKAKKKVLKAPPSSPSSAKKGSHKKSPRKAGGILGAAIGGVAGGLAGSVAGPGGAAIGFLAGAAIGDQIEESERSHALYPRAPAYWWP